MTTATNTLDARCPGCSGPVAVDPAAAGDRKWWHEPCWDEAVQWGGAHIYCQRCLTTVPKAGHSCQPRTDVAPQH